MTDPVAESVTLREHIDARLAAMQRENDVRFNGMEKATAQALAAAEKATAAALDAAQRAVTKAEGAVDKRLEGMNEFRGALSDATTTLMPRAEAENRMSQIVKDLATLQSRLDKGEGRGAGLNSGAVYTVMAIAGVGGLLGIIAAIMKFAGG